MPFDNPRVWQPLDLAPLPVALAYDLYVCRRLYPMMAIGLLVHLARLNAEPFANSELWLSDELLSARSGKPQPSSASVRNGSKRRGKFGSKTDTTPRAPEAPDQYRTDIDGCHSPSGRMVESRTLGLAD